MIRTPSDVGRIDDHCPVPRNLKAISPVTALESRLAQLILASGSTLPSKRGATLRGTLPRLSTGSGNQIALGLVCGRRMTCGIASLSQDPPTALGRPRSGHCSTRLRCVGFGDRANEVAIELGRAS